MVISNIKVNIKHKSNREQDKFNKIQFFKVPNDPNVINEWQIAILRDDIKLRHGNVVCSLHFNSEDIIREKTFTGPDPCAQIIKKLYLNIFSN